MTEEIEEIAKRLVVGHKRDGRSIYNPQARSDLVRAIGQPGVSLAKIARTCGINASVGISGGHSANSPGLIRRGEGSPRHLVVHQLGADRRIDNSNIWPHHNNQTH